MLTNQPSNLPFDPQHLKQVIAELEQAKKKLDKEEKDKKAQQEKEAESRSGVSSLSPQLSPHMKRDKFAKAVVGTPLFKDLQLKFFKIIPDMGQKMLTVCQDAYNKGTLTNEQRNTLATIGNTLVSELPFKMLGEGVDVQAGFKEFIGALRKTHEFFADNQNVASDIGKSILDIFKPLESFITSTTKVVKKSDAPESIKEGFSAGLNQMQTQSKKVTDTIRSAIEKHVPAPSIDLTRLPIISPLIKTLQDKLLPTIFPIGGAILKLANSDILNNAQRKELAEIGKGIMSLPSKFIKGEIDFIGVLKGLGNGLKSLANFFIKNPGIVIKAGAIILPAMVPCGGFLAMALKSDFAQNAMGKMGETLKTTLGSLTEQFSSVEKTFENSAQRELSRTK
jgi:hypothetical protein